MILVVPCFFTPGNKGFVFFIADKNEEHCDGMSVFAEDGDLNEEHM